MTFVKVLIMVVLVFFMALSIYRFATTLRSYIKAKKDKTNKGANEHSKSNENIIKEDLANDSVCINGANHHNSI